jgi:hypothetical protein
MLFVLGMFATCSRLSIYPPIQAPSRYTSFFPSDVTVELVCQLFSFLKDHSQPRFFRSLVLSFKSSDFSLGYSISGLLRPPGRPLTAQTDSSRIFGDSDRPA